MSVFDKVKDIRKNTVIFHEGDDSSFLYIIKTGKIRIVKELDGRIIPLAALGPQGLIGETSLFNDAPRSATAIAVEPTQLLMVKKTDIRKVMKDCPDWVNDFMRTLSDRLMDVSTILAEHNISNDLDPEEDISPEEAVSIKKLIAEYVDKRG